MKRQSYYAGRYPRYPGKRGNKQHATNQQETCHQGGEAERGGRPKHYTRHTTNHTEEERRGARRQQRTEGEHDTHAPGGVRKCLSGVQKGAKDHTMMNTSVREHTAPQQHRKHGVEGKDPHTGPKAFVAMRHNEEGRQCATTLHAQRQGNQAVAGSQRYPEGGTSKTWVKAPKRTIRGGGGATSGREQINKNRTIIQGTNT